MAFFGHEQIDPLDKTSGKTRGVFLMSVAPDTEVTTETITAPAENASVSTEADSARSADEAAVAEPSAATDAIAADSDDACFRLLLDSLETGGLVADQIRDALDQELDSETLLDRLTEALADEGAPDAELREATPTLAAITIRSLLQALGTDQAETDTVQGLTAAAALATQALIESGIPGAIQALPGLLRQLIHRADRDRIGGAQLIPVLRRIAERVALDPDLVRRLSGREPLSRPLATAAYGAAKFRQQPMRCRIDGPVEIIIVRR